MAKLSTRQRIIEAADQLFYEQGFEHTSFAQIAQAVGISRGNFYYHFRTKDEILNGVIEYRCQGVKGMLQQWEADEGTPADRIRRFIHIVVANRSKIKDYGCPIGTLSSELAKLDHPAQSGAARLFTLFRAWLRRQFEELGRKAEADELAMHVLAFSQGVATLTHAFQDETFIRNEVNRMNDWLRTL